MGRIIQYRLLQSENQTGMMRPVVYCDEKYCESLQQVSLNEKMAALLIKIKPERRTMRIERCFQEVLANIPENSCIRDFDVLFNPAYKIMVIHIARMLILFPVVDIVTIAKIIGVMQVTLWVVLLFILIMVA